MKTTSVSFFITSTHPNTGKLIVFLRVRGEFNPETAQIEGKWGKQSYPGMCQPTAHGKTESGETLLDTLVREIGEEIAQFFAGYISGRFTGRKLEPVCVYENNKSHVEIYHQHMDWALTWRLPLDVIRTVVLPDQIDQIRIADPSNKEFRENGTQDRCEIVMFPEYITALRLIAQEFAPHHYGQ